MTVKTLFAGAAARAVLDAWAVLAPTECSGCGAPDLALCAACRYALAPQVHLCRRDGVPVWVALDYSGVARRVIGAYKDGGRTDAAGPLAAPLRAAVVAALSASTASAPPPGAAGVHLVIIPSSRRAWRARGYHPVELLLGRAGLAQSPVLRQAADVADQVGLGKLARDRNKRGSLVARRPLDGLRCLVVDDIVTTGATILEARRAVLEAGGEVVGLVALAETRRLHGAVDGREETAR
jgi:predicted amidophosphoribosyltransferase